MTRARESAPPDVFTLETALACNLRCPECAIGGGLIERPKGYLTYERFERIAEKIQPYCKHLYLHLWGEPLLNRDIVRMVRRAAGFSATNLSTNALMLTPELAEELVTSGLSELIVSIDGVSQEVYEKYRVGGDVREAFAGLELLQELNARHGSKVAISPQFIVFGHNQHEMAAFAERCQGIGLAPSFKAPYLRRGNSQFALSDRPGFTRPHHPDVASLRAAMRACANPRNVFTALLDGTVVVCCHDYAGATRFGNIFDQDVLEIWNSPAYRQFRADILEGRAPGFCVESCMSWFLDTAAAAAVPARPVAPGRPVPLEPPVARREAQAPAAPDRVNLCSGPRQLAGWLNVDVTPGADLVLDLEDALLPLGDGTVDAVVCMSAINYFSPARAAQIIRDVHRVLRPGGVARFGTQDLRVLARRYLERDEAFWLEKLPDGTDRFPGATLADKLNGFFSGFRSGGKPCRHVHDFDSLSQLFRAAGFAVVEERAYRDSRLAEVEEVDNRPEQMFFLEAVKDGPAAPRAAPPPAPTGRTAAQQAAPDGDLGPERAWQLLLARLEAAPGDLDAVRACSAVLSERGRFDDLARLCDRALTVHPGDPGLRELLAAARRGAGQRLAERDALAQTGAATLVSLRGRLNRVLGDREHLDAAMRWLCRAQDQNGRGGVSAIYTIATRSWDVDYPETTGYIIPTFLAYAELTGSSEHRARAERMGAWELAIQAPDGGTGEPVGVYGLMPRVFNTGQVMLGWLALYRCTGQARWLDALRRAGDWIASRLDADGKWTRSTYRGPRSYKSRVAWALLELHALTGELRYRRAAERSIAWILAQAEPNGWFRECSLGDPAKPWTHLLGYVLVGLQECLRHPGADFDQERVATLLDRAALGLSTAYLEAKEAAPPGRFVTLSGTFDRAWRPGDAWSCVTGTTQLEFFLRGLGTRRSELAFVRTADALIDDVKRVHLVDGITDPDLRGGLPGSFPIDGGYCPGALPNWGVKFFADSLLQRLVPPLKLQDLG